MSADEQALREQTLHQLQIEPTSEASLTRPGPVDSVRRRGSGPHNLS